MTPSNKLYVWNLPPDVSPAALRELFSTAATVHDVRLNPQKSPHTALVTVEDVAQAEALRYRFEGYVMGANILHLGYDLPADGKDLKLYVHNLPPQIQPEHLHKLFDPMGDVVGIEMIKDRAGAFLGAAIVEMVDDPGYRMAMHNLHQLNVVGYTIRVEPLRGSLSFRGLPLPPNEETAMHDLADELGEFRPGPIDQIRDIARYMGLDFVRDMVRQVQQVEAEGGMMTKDGSRRRTPGGVFFALAREAIPPKLVPVIFSNRD